MGVKRSFENFQDFSLEQPKQLVSGSKASFISESFGKDFQRSKKSSPEHPKLVDYNNKLTLFAEPVDVKELQDSSMASPLRAKQLAPGCKLTSSVESLAEEHQESPRRQVKQLVLETRFASLAEDCCSHETSPAIGEFDKTYNALVPEGVAKVDFNKPHWYVELGNIINRDAAAIVIGNRLETSVLISRVTSSSGMNDVRSGDAFFSSPLPEYVDFNVSKRPVAQLEDTYSSLLNSSPRKQVPVGLDYQADIPLWVPKAVKKEPMMPKGLNDDYLMGTCIISLPDTVIASDGCMKVAQGRRFCGCFDKGSIRCVQIHVKEAREKLKETIGVENYELLGFCKMGEDVAHEWTEEEECIIHEAIYSNPASRGRNFWEELSMVFSSRSNMELVSYYFNVFILQRRAVQNRSMLLEIDSDDDEWSGNGNFHVIEEDEDSDIEVDDGDDSCEVDIRAGAGVGDEDHMSVYDFQRQASNSENVTLHDGDSDLEVHSGVKSNTMEGVDEEEKLNTSSESQKCTIESGGSVDVGSDAQEKQTHDNYFTQWLGGESNDSNDISSSCGFIYDSFDAKVWDTSCSSGFSKGVDILPTCSMMDELFGPFTPKRDQVN